ncbi:hypothetical protein LZ554_008871 [Drepanopeziza brunnea f. sp. 'monogermtubi']|nr:hypothetical protein LZ554_008871 [Drepanopeziza brunnea f. sp. 'monogermtubi']
MLDTFSRHSVAKGRKRLAFSSQAFKSFHELLKLSLGYQQRAIDDMVASLHYELLWLRDDSPVLFECTACHNVNLENPKQSYSTVDMILSKPRIGSQSQDLPTRQDGIFIRIQDSRSKWASPPADSPFASFLENVLSTQTLTEESAQPATVIIKFILSRVDGYVARSDFLERRLQGYELAEKVQGFLLPRQQVKAVVEDKITSPENLFSLLKQALGAISISSTTGSSIGSLLTKTEEELLNRLSFPWSSSEPIEQKRIAWVEGRPDFEFSRRMYEAAWALGITLVIIDNPGHWMSQDEGDHVYLREAFIPVNISVDEGFVDRIINAVQSYGKPFDSIISVSDARVVGVAQACEILGYPTSPSAAYILAADKYKTRLNELDQRGCFQVNGVEELKVQLEQQRDQLQYPLVAKPCMGWGSECISKVNNEAELIQAVEKASARHATSPQRRTEVMIEPFIDGPEVDANFVLLDGKILFYEIADDFPSPGDYPGSSWEDNFQETANLLPCGLPADELLVVRDSIHQSLLRLGFQSGTFHCEGRVRYSTLHFDTRNGREDLYPTTHIGSTKSQPQFYLHEINARPAGYLESVATHLTYGVDYYALQLLYSLGDKARYRALAQPFLNGPQWWLVLLIIPEDRAGTMKTEDAGKSLLARDPILAAAVPDYKTVQKRGGKLGGPKASALSYLAYFSVVSRRSRLEALELADRIRKNFRYELEED